MRHVMVKKTILFNGYCINTRSDGWHDSERVLNDRSRIRGKSKTRWKAVQSSQVTLRQYLW